MLKEFREFILRGNLIDLAVAIVLGTAFGVVVTTFVSSLITPLIAAIGGQPDFAELDFTINGSRFTYGVFLNAVIAFIIIAAVIFIFVIKPVNRLMENRKSEAPADERTRSCPECRSDIPALASRCAYCTTQVTPEEQPASA